MQSQMYVDAKKDGLKALLKKLQAMMGDDSEMNEGDLESKLAEAQEEDSMEQEAGLKEDSDPMEEMTEPAEEKAAESLKMPDLDLEEMKEFMKSRRKPVGGKSINIMASIQKKQKPELKLKKYG